MSYSDYIYSLSEKSAMDRLFNKPKSELYEKIKASDFLISDKSGTHRLVGLFYDKETMYAPKITLICMRHEVAAAKQIAFSLGKAIYADDELSASLFRKNIGGANGADVLYHLGSMYKRGWGVQKDYAKAEEYFTKAAERGNADVQWELLYFYYEGKYVKKNKPKVFKYLRMLAEQGCAAAQFLLGVAYEQGEYLKQDYTKAFELYTKSADQGNSDAQKKLNDKEFQENLQKQRSKKA